MLMTKKQQKKNVTENAGLFWKFPFNKTLNICVQAYSKARNIEFSQIGLKQINFF